LKKRPFTTAETDELIMMTTVARPIFVPGRYARPPHGDLLSGRQTLEKYVAEAPMRIGPVTDDSPFFFARYRPLGMPSLMVKGLGLLLIPIVSLLALLVVRSQPRGDETRSYAASVVYFASLGLGFIAVELSLLQNLTLLMGHPVFTLSILVATLLSCGGVGSAASGRFPTRIVCGAVALMAAVYALLLPRVVTALLPLSLAGRTMSSVFVIAPLGFAMGMPFPQGLKRVGRGPLPAPPFYWGLNGVMSIIGSIATVAIAVMLGFRAAMLAGGCCYLLAAMSSGFTSGHSAAQ
jgi:hypothetical protein